jgi:gliding motility-associated-like protein
MCNILYSSIAFTQTSPPALNWALRFGGSAVDIPYTIKFTTDGGTVIAGYTDSKDGQVSPHANREYWDLWVVKSDACGTIQWELSLGGTGYESARDIEQTADGGYIVLGETNSTDGGVIAGYGGTKDIWLIKLSATGAVQWQKRYGGSGLDIGNQISITTGGDYLIAASTSSNDGDVAGNHGTGGYTDGLIMKISSAGNVIYSKCFGGTKNEELLKIITIGNRTFATGYANSIDGDIPPDQKNYDAWLLALDDAGNKIFSKIYGGSQNDVAYSMTAGNDGSLTLAGYTTSNDGDVSGAKGSQDYWVFNVTQAGVLNWQKVLGGTDADYCNAVLTDGDGGYLAAGISYSGDGDIDDARGEGDYWLVKLSSAGNIVWKKNYGGSENDHLRSIIYKPALREYYLAGDSGSGDGEFTSAFGDVDFGIIKLKNPFNEIKDTTVCNLAGFVPITDTLRDACGYDSVFVEYNPVVINGPLHDIKKSDTIFIGQSLQLPSSGNGEIVWLPDPTLSCSSCAAPIAKPTVTTVYTVRNTLPHGCVVEDQYRLVVLNDAIVFTPNAFTPNADGLNDYFGPLGKVPEGFRLQVFNRYGETVFTSSTMNNRWDGRYKGSLQPMGTFIYVVIFQDIRRQQHQQKGYFTLIR